MNLPQHVNYLVVAFTCFAFPATAQSHAQLERDFRNLFVQAECSSVQNPSYKKCFRTPDLLIDYMDTASRMRSTCPHPLNYARFVQMALDCSSWVRESPNGSGDDVLACFVDAFEGKYSPLTAHYCYVISQEKRS